MSAPCHRLEKQMFTTWRRVVQGVGLWAVMLAVVAILLLAANSGSAPDACCLTPSLNTVSCFLRTYKELASGLLGAAGAIFAAWIAWLAVQRQIQSEELRATAVSRETLDVIRSVLKKDFLQVLEQIWRALDLAAENIDDEQKRRDRQAVALQVLKGLPPTENLRTLDQLSSAIGPGLRLKLIPVFDGFRLLYKTIGRGPPDEGGGGVSFYFFQLKFLMSRLVTCLREFDPALASMFDKRVKVDPEIQPQAESLKEMIDSNERGEYYSE